ncbi:ABC transporter ATP-binding protein [Leucobacter tardus]|uniref:ABC transporter ATP-binding protein n=1 Tax=Leucobacter tardus TaxID=501483 RepID=A0A939TNH7_9MICO|nr:ABC transporter ATP-binding protein [Leucobacter tardus]MBO2990553.1 ABC transporter ATP-binding protein [Leucobacter tardus]
MTMPDASPPVLAIRSLRKQFGQHVAVDDLSFDVPAGTMLGLLGPNGAGKTTTLAMATGLLQPDAGSAWVLGADVWQDPAAAKGRMGVLPDGIRMFDRLTGAELLRYSGLLRGLGEPEVRDRATELLDALGLAEAGSTLVVDYSAGMKKKIGLACALIHAPRLLILDEPLEAVDPVSGQTIRQILRAFVAGGGTVVLSSHVMELVESLCDRVAILAEGRLLAHGDLDEVRAGVSLQQRFLDLVGSHDLGEGTLAWLRSS